MEWSEDDLGRHFDFLPALVKRALPVKWPRRSRRQAATVLVVGLAPRLARRYPILLGFKESTNYVLSYWTMMTSWPYTLRVQRPEITEVNGQRVYTRAMAVLNDGRFVDDFHLLCAAIYNDIQSPAGAALVVDWVCKVEFRALDLAEVDGNAWVINITREKVWFESLYSQGEGGEVSLSQFKLAVQTYLQFLNDPERKPIEVEFPGN